MQTGRDRLFVARTDAAKVLLLLLLLILIAASPEVLSAQVRGRFGFGRPLRRRARDQRGDRRIVDGRPVAAVARIEVARRVPVVRRHRLCRGRVVERRRRRFGGGGGGGGGRRVVDAAARLLARRVHPGQRIVAGRTARRVRLLDGRRRLAADAIGRWTATAAGARSRRRRRGQGPRRLPRQRGASR